MSPAPSAGTSPFQIREIRPGDDAAVEAVIRSFFSGHLLGKGILLAQLGSLIYGVEGVKNYRFSAPTQDLAASDSVLPVLGALTLTNMEA